MSTLSISLPEPMKIFVDAEAAAGGYNTTSDYVNALIREAQERKANALREEAGQEDRRAVEESKDASAYDLFEGLLGGWGSSNGTLSENCGAKFAEGMAEKRAQRNL